MATVAVEAGGERLLVQAALPLEDAEETEAQLRAALALGVPAVVAVLAGTTWVLVGRAIRPSRRYAGRPPRSRRPASTGAWPCLPATTSSPGSPRRSTPCSPASRTRARAQREFLADAAHEIRSPLAALLTQLEVAHLQGGADDENEWREVLPLLVEDVDRLSRLVDDLLRLARLDAQAPVVRAPVDLDEIVLGTTARARRTSDLRIEARVAAARVLGDADALTRVAQNLLDNALRHAHSRVTVELGVTDSHVVLSVPTTAPASRPTRGRASSSGSRGSTRRAAVTAAGPDSALPSCGRWSIGTAATCGWRTASQARASSYDSRETGEQP